MSPRNSVLLYKELPFIHPGRLSTPWKTGVLNLYTTLDMHMNLWMYSYTYTYPRVPKIPADPVTLTLTLAAYCFQTYPPAPHFLPLYSTRDNHDAMWARSSQDETFCAGLGPLCPLIKDPVLLGTALTQNEEMRFSEVFSSFWSLIRCPCLSPGFFFFFSLPRQKCPALQRPSGASSL